MTLRANCECKQRHNCNTDVSNVHYARLHSLLFWPPFGHMHGQM